jgi:hypothetical protein
MGMKLPELEDLEDDFWKTGTVVAFLLSIHAHIYYLYTFVWKSLLVAYEMFGSGGLTDYIVYGTSFITIAFVMLIALSITITMIWVLIYELVTNYLINKGIQ